MAQWNVDREAAADAVAQTQDAGSGIEGSTAVDQILGDLPCAASGMPVIAAALARFAEARQGVVTQIGSHVVGVGVTGAGAVEAVADVETHVAFRASESRS
jgi:hypothetical protein